jgi:uroporphyrin-III C-methyltransferase/precorrin-2 dehydrogenase/sirohydrochlorin ferrochelatase
VVLEPSVCAGARLVLVATGCAGADAAAAAVARDQGALVNVVDRPDLCDVTTPALVDRDPVVVAIGTEGTSPVLSRQIKTRLEEILEPNLGAFAAWAGELRADVAQRVPKERRRRFWEWAFEEPRRLFTTGRQDAARALVAQALDAGGAPGGQARGRVSLVDAGPGPADLITLRGVQRMQSADVILHRALIDPSVLELARRDAERIALPDGTDPVPALIEAASAGSQVVWLSHAADAVDPAAFAGTGLDCERVAASAVGAFPEDGGADAHDRRAVGDGDLEIPAHAHR